MRLSTYLASALYNHVLRHTAYTSPVTVYAQFFSTAPAADGTGTQIAHTRVAVTMGADTDGSGANSAAISIADMPAATIAGVGLYDASSGGHLLMWGEPEAPIDWAAASAFSVAAGQLAVVFR